MIKVINPILVVLALLSLICLSYSCPNNCLYCQDNTTCITCITNYSLTQQGNCILPTISNCRIYSNSQGCLICQPTFKIQNGQCVKDYSGCLIRNKNGVCQQCFMGTSLDQNGNCLGVLNCNTPMRQCTNCAKGYILENNVCKYNKNDCSNVLANGLCANCLNGFVLNGFECVSKALNAISTNSNFIQYCSLYSQGQASCLQCQQGYSLFQNMCQSIGYVNKQTVGYANQKISQNTSANFASDTCPSLKLNKQTFSLAPNGANDILDGPVKQIDEIIFTGVGNQQLCLLKQANSAICQSCIDGYHLSNGICVKSTPICLQVNLTNFRCLKCDQNFAIINGDCIDLKCNVSSYSVCEVCNKGFILTSQAICKDPNCIQIVNGSCTKCSPNYLISNGICVVLIPNCRIYNADNTKCTQCSTGYNLDSNGKCESKDPKCLSFSGNNCIQCRPQFALINGLCFDLNCQFLSSPTTCNLCNSGFSLSPSGFCFDPNCGSLVNGSCIKCNNNYVLTNGTCFGNNNVCTSFSTNGSCLNCSSVYALINGTCVDLQCQNQQYVSGSYVCLNCKPGFNISSSGVCYDQNCFRTSNGSCTRCADNYVVNSNGLCKQINVGCLTFDSVSKKCVQCLSNYTINVLGECTTNNQIIPSQVDDTSTLTPSNITTDPNCLQRNNVTKVCISCVNRYYIINGLCTPVPKECQTFNMQTGKCFSCINGFALLQQGTQTTCIQKPSVADPNCLATDLNYFCIRCKIGFYTLNGLCYLADTMCRTFNLTGGQCLTCYDGYVLQQTKCVSLTEQANCKTFDFQNVCIACVDRYYLSKGVCIVVNSNCNTYQPINGGCLSCIDGYSLSNLACVLTTKQQNPKAKDPNCIIANANNNCLQCQSGFYVSQGNCAKVNPLCKTYDINNGYCTSCFDGYGLVSNSCSSLDQVVIQDPNCLLFSGTLCLSCKDRYFLNSSGSKLVCSSVNSACNSYNMFTGHCESCYSGSQLNGNSCVITNNGNSFGQNSALNCSQYDYSRQLCVTCYNGFYNDLTSKSCKLMNTLCKTTNSTNGQCLTCFDGYQLIAGNCKNYNSQITVNNVGSNIYCTKFNGTACIQCMNRYYVKNQTCFAIDPNCLTYNSTTGYCLQCYSGYLVNQIGCCILPNSNTISDPFCINSVNSKCISCLNGYYVDSFTGHCTAVSILCINYIMLTGECTRCASGSVLQDGVCFTPALGVDPNCALYSGVYCSGCNNGYRLISFVCQKVQ